MTKAYCYLKVLPALMLLFLLTGCIPFFDSPAYVEPIPNAPRTYAAEYGKVWNSALDVLDELGYVIAQMDKADGYITTERKEGDLSRIKVSFRIVREGNEVMVKVNQYYETRDIESFYEGTTYVRTYSPWSQKENNGHYEKWIKDKIAEKLGLTE